MNDGSELPARADVVWSAPGTTAWSRPSCWPAPASTSLVLEAADVIGGATRTERPFPKAPGLRHSTGSYLLG